MVPLLERLPHAHDILHMTCAAIARLDAQIDAEDAALVHDAKCHINTLISHLLATEKHAITAHLAIPICTSVSCCADVMSMQQILNGMSKLH